MDGELVYKADLVDGFAGIGTVELDDGTRVSNLVYIWDGAPEFGAAPMEHVFAHEIGHVVGNLPHSDEFDFLGCNAELVGTDPELRLMVSGGRYKPSKSPSALVKCEWERIHKWLVSPDDPDLW